MYAMGIDLGTNSVKSLILELETGAIMSLCQKGYGYIKGTSAEQDTESVRDMVFSSIRESIATSGVAPKLIKCIGLSGQMHGTVLYNISGECVSNIITWEDDRCDKGFLDKIADIGGADIEKSGCGIATGFMGPTVYHIAQNSDIKIGHVLLPTDWLRQELTGEKTFLTDHSNVSSSGFFDTRSRDWNYSLIGKLGLSEGIFPKASSTFDIDGSISDKVAEVTGLEHGTPVTVGGGDQPLSMIGSSICDAYDGSLLNIGTGSQVSRVGEYAKKKTIVFCFPGNCYSLLGAALSGGASLNWWRKVSEECVTMYGLNPPELSIYEEMSRIAEEAPPGANGLAFIPYLSGTRAKPELRATFAGLSRHHGYAHFTRAIMEGVVFELYYFYEKLGDQSDESKPLVGAGGGFSSKLWSQIASDVFSSDVRLTECHEQAALGAALIAGVTIGYYHNIKQACNMVRYSDVIHPIEENAVKYKSVYEYQYKKSF